MNVIFKVKKAENVDSLRREPTICKISSKNIFAYCVADESFSKSNFSLKTNIFVSDLLSPWKSYLVCYTENLVNVLEWNYTGELLLIAEGSCIKLWRCLNQILNKWLPAFTINLKCENIVSCNFFHNGKKIYFNTQKRDCFLYTEKFEKVKNAPTLRQFGRVAAEGCIVLTSSGLIGVFFIPYVRQKILYEESKVGSVSCEINIITQSLGLVRNYIECSAIAYCSNGCFRIATCGAQDKFVHCFNVNIKFDDGNIVINKESLPSIFLSVGDYKTEDSFKITHIKWAVVDNEEFILIAYNFDNKTMLEQWNLIPKQQSIHKFLQKNKAEVFPCDFWEKVAKSHISTNVSDICLSKNYIDNQYIYMVLMDNTVQILERGLKNSGVIKMSKFVDEKHDVKLYAIDISVMNHIILLIDNYGQLYALQVCNNYFDLKQNDMLAMQASLLEYSIISGLDASDILLFTLSNMESLIEKLTENFMRQPLFIRHFYYSNFLALKSNMCRMHSMQNDFDNLIILHSISIAFKSLLRPSDLACHDKGPADSLSIVLADALPDVDKVLCNLDAKDFTVEPLTLQSLQQLMQWIADLTLNIINKLPGDVLQNNSSKKLCYELTKDSVALTSIRELLAMIRIWGLLNSQCLPIYTKSTENVDILAVLFRLLTRLSQNPLEPDDVLIDECITLSTQVLNPNYKFFNQVITLNVYTSMKSIPVIFTNGIEPTGQLQEICFEDVIYSSGTKDGVSNVLLGGNPKKLKECIRCGFFNGFNISKTSAMKAWCQRYINCRCGGYWKID